MLEHVYREFNANAVSVANESIDQYHGFVVVINENWSRSVHPMRVTDSLRDPAHGERDADGNAAED